ncbi:hypothetical protein C7820_3199 [Paenibacillus sp. VMFN-D1]|uniref:Uncharacterized protein n=1 Tax=Paenibacillus favisporus TaxID=221028 RepID=A0ABV2FBX8_9BACL|nr:hypothetical protein C7820_3199 [Paenibacillus sp. VMFN-D1]
MKNMRYNPIERYADRSTWLLDVLLYLPRLLIKLLS